MTPLANLSTRPASHLQILAILAILAVLAIDAVHAAGQAPPREALQRPAPREFKTGNGRITGRVLTMEGTPLRRAQVRIGGPEVAPKAALTDADGRYEFRDLPAGRFTLTATKSGYVTVQFGQTRPFESGKPIELSENQRVDKADITMPRGGVISGRILDEFGDPVPDAMVSALRSTWAAGKRRLVNAGRAAVTNDLGQYRLFGLPPGEYYISASLRSGDTMMFVETMPGATVASPVASSPNSGYSPTYYPGTASGADAQRIAIAAGQEAQSTDFALLAVRLVKVTGIVINSEGKPVDSAMVNAVQRNSDIGGFVMPHTARTDRSGSFTLTGLPPGDYMLQTRSVQIFSGGDGNAMVFSARVAGPGAGGDPEFGMLPISVGAEDLSGVTVTTTKGTTASGRVLFEGGATPPNITALRVAAIPGEGEMMPMMAGPGGPGQTLSAEGTFELRGLFGQRFIRVLNPPQGWMVDAVRLDGNDVTDTGVEFKTGDPVSGVEIVMTARPSEISGTVKGANGALAKDYTVVIFSTNADKWTAPAGRYVMAGRPDQQGRFRVRNLPAGDYYAIALEYIEQGTWGDPELLERMKPKATRLSVQKGENKMLDLELSGAIIP